MDSSLEAAPGPSRAEKKAARNAKKKTVVGTVDVAANSTSGGQTLDLKENSLSSTVERLSVKSTGQGSGAAESVYGDDVEEGGSTIVEGGGAKPSSRKHQVFSDKRGCSVDGSGGGGGAKITGSFVESRSMFAVDHGVGEWRDTGGGGRGGGGKKGGGNDKAKKGKVVKQKAEDFKRAGKKHSKPEKPLKAKDQFLVEYVADRLTLAQADAVSRSTRLVSGSSDVGGGGGDCCSGGGGVVETESALLDASSLVPPTAIDTDGVALPPTPADEIVAASALAAGEITTETALRVPPFQADSAAAIRRAVVKEGIRAWAALPEVEREARLEVETGLFVAYREVLGVWEKDEAARKHKMKAHHQK